MSESRQANPTAAILIVGDEILSGRTRDANMHYLAGELNRIGIALKEVRIVSDNHRSIMAAVNALRVAFDHVFTSGGIGPTHDDITADAIAAAFDVAIGVREDARALLALDGRPGGVVEVADPSSWQPMYGRPAEAQAVWERTHGRALPDPSYHAG